MSAARNYAHFFSRTARKPAELIVTVTPSLTSATVFHANVVGKAEARKYAAQHGAQCWNF
jgi:hypothetical protein